MQPTKNRVSQGPASDPITQISEYLKQREGQILPLKLTYASKATQTVHLYYAAGKVGIMPRSKRQRSTVFVPRETVVSFVEAKTRSPATAQRPGCPQTGHEAL